MTKPTTATEAAAKGIRYIVALAPHAGNSDADYLVISRHDSRRAVKAALEALQPANIPHWRRTKHYVALEALYSPATKRKITGYKEIR